MKKIMHQNRSLDCRIPRARWQITETTSVERRNLFNLDTGREAHLATIVAASRSRIHEFNQIVNRIEKIPEIMDTLDDVQVLLDEIAFMEDVRIRLTRQKIRDLLYRITNINFTG